MYQYCTVNVQNYTLTAVHILSKSTKPRASYYYFAKVCKTKKKVTSLLEYVTGPAKIGHAGTNYTLSHNMSYFISEIEYFHSVTCIV